MIFHKVNGIRAGFALSYLSMGINILIGLTFIPYMLRMLGQNEFGLYSLIGSLVSYLSLFDLGVSTTTLRFVSRYLAQGNKSKLEKYVATCFVIYAVIGILIIITGSIIYRHIDVIFASSLDATQIDKARIMFAILLGTLAVSFIGQAYSAVMKAYEKFVMVKGIEIGKNFVRTLLVFILLSFGYDSLGIVIIDAALNIFITIVQFIYVRYSLDVHTVPRKCDKEMVRKILNFSTFVFLSVLINQVNLRMGSFVLGIVSNTAQIAIFALGMTLTIYYTQFSSAFSGLFMPRLTHMIEKNRSMSEVEDVLIRVSRFQVKLLTLIIVGFIVVGKQFILLWVGPEYKQAYNVIILMMVAYYLPYTQTTLNTLAQVMNKHKIRNSIYAITAVGNIILMFFLSKQGGAIGAALSTCITMLIGYGVFIQLYYKRGMGVNMLSYLKKTYLDTIPAATLGLSIGILINHYSNSTWLFTFYNIIAVVIVYTIGIWFLGANSYEKEQVRIVALKIYSLQNKKDHWEAEKAE